MLSLFAGIGGLDLGLERAGMHVVGQVEIDPYCRAILAKHWPDVPQHDDVHTTVEWWTKQKRPRVDVICGGFPCQPFSVAANFRRKGIADERWLWPAMRDVIAEVRPGWVIAENVPALLRDVAAFRTVLTDLSALGFIVQWDVLSACAVGAPHRRRRLFAVAYSESGRRAARRCSRSRRISETAASEESRFVVERQTRWSRQPVVRRVAYGIPGRVDRVKALGNAVVPDVAQQIGEMIIEHPDRWISPANHTV